MADKNWYVDVILPLPLHSSFTYKISSEQKNKIDIGYRGTVQFGKKKIYTAIVTSVHQNRPEGYEIKDIISVLDSYPVVNPIQLQLWKWIADYYLCPVGDVYKAALPAGLKLESETKIYPVSEISAEIKLTADESLILDVLTNNSQISISKLQLIAGKKDATPIIKSLSEKGLITLEQEIREGYKPKTKTFIRISDEVRSKKDLHDLFTKLEKLPKQLNLLMAYMDLSGVFSKRKPKEVEKSEVIKKAGVTASVLKSLIVKKIFYEVELETGRLNEGDTLRKEIAELNESQSEAIKQIKSFFSEKEIVLLHGVTSSGKTEIYIHLIEEQIKRNKQVLYLLPEIALTTQIINRLKAVFGNKVGVYHSKFSDNQRVEVWNNLLGKTAGKSERFKVILGVRSSVFLPFNNLGLVIIDEEHENTYKQFDPSPRYHARDTAIVLASIHRAKVLLGTATPSLECYYNALSGKYAMVELKERYLNLEMPEIKVANVREARKRKEMCSLFTPILLNSISKALENKEQIILFQNRRGFSPYLECDICGYIPVCKHCDVSLTYHKFNNQLICHYCGYTIKNPKSCSSCGGMSLLTKGFGTEKVEDEIALIFPDAKISRLDLDTTRSRKSYEKIISDFENSEVDILVGTQMISKGLDFDNVKVVGILNADNMLNFPDFRAYERSFQLMAQVSGRAGRKNGRGLVIIQTSEPENSVVKNVVTHNYLTFFNQQLEERSKFKYPPYFRLIEVVFKHKKLDTLNLACDMASKLLKKEFGTRVLGPEFPLLSKIHDYHLKKFLIKFEKSRILNDNKARLYQILNELHSGHQFNSLIISVDVDPM